MGRCVPIDDRGWIELKLDFDKLRLPPEGMKVVKVCQPGRNYAHLVDLSVCSFQGDGKYCIKVNERAAEEVKYIFRDGDVYRICEGDKPDISDRIIEKNHDVFVGRVVNELAVFY